MFDLKIINKKYRVEFEHHNPATKNYKGLATFPPGTKCTIKESDDNWGEFNWVNTYKGFSTLHKNDIGSFNKDKGRKISLTNALKEAFPGYVNRSTRKLFWKAYFETLVRSINKSSLSKFEKNVFDEAVKTFDGGGYTVIESGLGELGNTPLGAHKYLTDVNNVSTTSNYENIKIMGDTLKVEIVDGGKEPFRKHIEDNCWDLYGREIISSFDDNGYLYVKVLLGVKVAPPKGYGIEAKVRSSFGKVGAGWYLTNGVGEIDENYRGELIAIFRPTMVEGRFKNPVIPFPYSPGDRIIQMKVVKKYDFPIEIVSDIGISERGEGGFGSTGEK